MRLLILGRVGVVYFTRGLYGQLLDADQCTMNAGLVDAQLCRALFRASRESALRRPPYVEVDPAYGVRRIIYSEAILDSRSVRDLSRLGVIVNGINSRRRYKRDEAFLLENRRTEGTALPHVAMNLGSAPLTEARK